MSRSQPKSPLEKKIQADIEAAIGAEPDLLLLRNSVGEAEYVNESNGRNWHVPYGLGEGSPDLVAILRHRTRSDDPLDPPCTLGIWFCLEVKSETGIASEAQLKCHRIWRSFGAYIEVVRSVDEARSALKRARARHQ